MDMRKHKKSLEPFKKAMTIELLDKLSNKIKSMVACAYAKGVADGCKHMLKTYRKM